MNSFFKVFYTTYYKRVYSTCLLILKNHHLAEEATQEAFIKAYKNIDKLEDADKYGAWVATIASRSAIDMYRDNQKIVIIDDNDVIDYLINQKTENLHNPHYQLENLELNKEMKLAITRLPPQANQIIILKYYWQLKDQEIADMLEIPIGTVKSSLHRSKGTLFKILPSINKDYLKLIEGDK